MLLFDFPDRFTSAGDQLLGSVDDVTWFSPESVGDHEEAVPAGAAVFVRGWAPNVAVDGPATNVVVVVDGIHKHRARAGLARPDVAKHFDDDRLGACGFEALITTGRLAGGEHAIAVYAVDPQTSHYAKLAETKTFTVAADWQTLRGDESGARINEGNIDDVRDEAGDRRVLLSDGTIAAPHGSTLWVRGWFCDPAGALVATEAYALVDGERAFPLNYGLPRPDVAAEFAVSGDGVGFEGRISTAGLHRGVHTLAIVSVIGENIVRTPIVYGLVVGQAARTMVALAETTLAFLDDVVRVERGAARALGAPLRVLRGDRLFVRGWAVDESLGRAAAGVVMLVDGQTEFALLYGLPRPDIADAFGNPAFARTGFSGEIDTSLLDVGMHAAECRVLAGDGRGALATAQRFEFEVIER